MPQLSLATDGLEQHSGNPMRNGQRTMEDEKQRTETQRRGERKECAEDFDSGIWMRVIASEA
jgi:hypothetical protein